MALARVFDQDVLRRISSCIVRLEFVLRYDHCMAMCLDFGFRAWVGYSSPSSPLRKFRDKFTFVDHWLSDLVA